MTLTSLVTFTQSALRGEANYYYCFLCVSPGTDNSNLSTNILRLSGVGRLVEIVCVTVIMSSIYTEFDRSIVLNFY